MGAFRGGVGREHGPAQRVLDGVGGEVVESAGVLDDLLRDEDGIAGVSLYTVGKGKGRVQGFAFAGEPVDESVPRAASGAGNGVAVRSSSMATW